MNKTIKVQKLVAVFLHHLGKSEFQSPEQEELFSKLLDDTFDNVDELIKAIYTTEEATEEHISQHRNKVLKTLTSDVATKITNKSYLDFVDPTEANLEGITESTKPAKFSTTLAQFIPTN